MTIADQARYAVSPVPLYHADLHMHTDYDHRRSLWHGERPEVLAQAIVSSGIDLFAITEHNRVTSKFFDVRDEVARLLELEQTVTGQSREIQAVLGMELAVLFDSGRYHMGVLFQDVYVSEHLPDVPPTNQHMHELEEYRATYGPVCILNHPTIRRTDPAITQDFMQTGLVDGVEILNGSVFLNNRGAEHTRQACEFFTDLREQQQEAYRNAPASERRSLPRIAPIGSSDAHRASLVGCATTEYLGERPLDLFDAIKTGQTKAVFRGSPLACDALSALGVHKIQKFLGWERTAGGTTSDVA